MRKFNINNVDKPNVSSSTKEDPYASATDKEKARIDEWEDAKHTLSLFLYKWVLRGIIVFGIIFLPVLFLVIMPFSEIQLGAQSWSEWVRNYSTAFVAALGSFGTTVVAIIVSEMLKRAYQLIKDKQSR